MRELQNDSNYFLKVTDLIFTNKNLTLRQQEKIFSLARISLRSFNSNSYVIPEILLFLSYLKIDRRSFFDDLKFKKLNIHELQENFLKTVISNKTEKTENALILLEAHLINFYNNYLHLNYYQNNLFKFNEETGSNELLINCVICKDKNNSLLRILENLSNSREGGLDLGYFINRIDLMKELTI